MKKLIPYFLILLTSLIAAASVQKAEAATISGSEPLVGFSKALADYYKRQAPGEDLTVELLSRAAENKRQNEILCRIVEAEATGGTIEQKMNVASCILARVASPDWPNSIEEVVFQNKQFSPISDGRYYTVTITEETREAVELVRQEGWSHTCIWFCTPTCSSARSGFHSRLKFAFADGMHNFYY